MQLAHSHHNHLFFFTVTAEPHDLAKIVLSRFGLEFLVKF